MSQHDETTPVLEALRALFSGEGSWVAHGELSPFHLSQAEDGDWVRFDSPRAVRWTLEGAVAKLCGDVVVNFWPLAIEEDQTPVKRRLSQLVSNRLMAVNYREDGHRDLRVHSDEGGREGILELIESALSLSGDDVRTASESVRKIDQGPAKTRVLPEPEPPPPMPDEVWEQPMGKRLPDGDYELTVPFDGDYRVYVEIFAINGNELDAPPSDGIYKLAADDVLSSESVGHLYLIEQREPHEVGRWFRYEWNRRMSGVRMSELHSENARDRQ